MTKYSRVGPPFNFSGHMNESQREAMYKWMEARLENFKQIKEYYQIRAQQLRKSAGVLEFFYKNYSPDSPTPTFIKDAWTPGKDGHFLYNITSDQAPANVVSDMKEPFQEQLQIDEEAVFWMNWLRNTIEKQEDKAQMAFEGSATYTLNKNKLNALFSDPAYSRVLVRKADEKDFSVHQLDERTDFEKKQFSHSDTINLVPK